MSRQALTYRTPAASVFGPGDRVKLSLPYIHAKDDKRADLIVELVTPISVTVTIRVISVLHWGENVSLPAEDIPLWMPGNEVMGTPPENLTVATWAEMIAPHVNVHQRSGHGEQSSVQPKVPYVAVLDNRVQAYFYDKDGKYEDAHVVGITDQHKLIVVHCRTVSGQSFNVEVEKTIPLSPFAIALLAFL